VLNLPKRAPARIAWFRKGPGMTTSSIATARQRLDDCGLAISLEMEWHMKRLYQRSGFRSGETYDPRCELKIQPDWKWVLLWRENQRHRPPSKL
jgi:hypothetical protein